MTGAQARRGWAEGARPWWAVPAVATTTALAAAMTVLLLLPLPDGPRRWAVLGLFCALLVVQVVAGVALWRGGYRPLSPGILRIIWQAAPVWGLMTGFSYAVPHPGEQSALVSAVSGAGIGVFFAVVLWLADPTRPTSRSRR